MTTPTIDQIYRHASVRRFKSEPVPRELVETIVAAAQRSATSSNLQMYSVVAVTDPAHRVRLAELCGDQAQVAQAPVFLAWCADRSRLNGVCRLRGYTQAVEHVEPFLVAAVDVAILMQTATLAAESLGLGSCYIGAIRNNPVEVIELLRLPPLTFPIPGMTLGRREMSRITYEGGVTHRFVSSWVVSRTFRGQDRPVAHLVFNMRANSILSSPS